MPIQDTWDWPFLYYAGTVLLKMNPGMFWRTTPRKLDILIKVHIDLSKDKKQSNAPTGYIDQLF
jgi:uncharacterized phage protein (TIGR02216 family)